MAKKKSKNQKHYNKSYKKIAFVVVLILIIIMFINLKNKTIKTYYEDTQIVLNNENITQKLQEPIIQDNSKIYMSIEDIKQFIDKTVYIEDQTGWVITTSSKKLAALKKEEEHILINGSKMQVKDVIIEKEGKMYILISELENVYDYDLEYIPNSNIVTIDYLNKKCVKAYAKKNINIKEKKQVFSKAIDKVNKGNWLYIIEQENSYVKVKTQNGIIGYVKKGTLNNFVNQRDDFEEKKEIIKPDNVLEYDITKEDISSFEKRINLINKILQETIKNDKMYVKIINNKDSNFEFERLKIEAPPMLQECGITVEI